MKYDHIQLSAVLQFWFAELTPKQWFAGGEELDAEITKRFADIHTQVAAGECWMLRTDAYSYLAEIIVLDQFSRQVFRGSAQAFAYDGQALLLAQHAIAAGYDTALTDDERMFLYLPFMHSESKEIHEQALVLFASLGKPEALEYEQIHKDIIDQFGRYPHRNQTLGRESTASEIEYLENTEETFF
jgi:uncharacterized protein (DUF924 family)